MKISKELFQLLREKYLAEYEEVFEEYLSCDATEVFADHLQHKHGLTNSEAVEVTGMIRQFDYFLHYECYNLLAKLLEMDSNLILQAIETSLELTEAELD